MMTEDICSTSLVSSWIECIHDSRTCSFDRQTAHKALEQFKDEYTDLCSVGFGLASNKSLDIIVRHCGLQLVEHAIKYRWNDLPTEQKLNIRQNWFQYLQNGIDPIEIESNHIKEAMTRCLVEMVKQEWPQNWPDMIEQLNEAKEHSHSSAQIIFLSLLRLFEDVVEFQNVEPAIRRRELHNGLTLSLKSLLHMSFQVLAKCSETSEHNFGQPNVGVLIGIDSETESSKRERRDTLLAKSVLEFLSELMEWSPVKELEPYLTDLLTLLSRLLTCENSTFRVESTLCMWKLASRKRTKSDEIGPVLGLFSKDCMTAILTAAQHAADHSHNYEHYCFLKNLCSLLTALGQHLSSFPNDQQFEKIVESFPLYLSAILAFYGHPSVHLRNEASQVIVAFVTHKVISKSQLFFGVLPQIMQLVPEVLQKSGLPSASDSTSCLFSKLDYDSDAEFLVEYTQLRERTLRMVRGSVAVDWRPSFEICHSWLQNKAIIPEQVSEIEFDAANRLLKSVFETIFSTEIFDDNKLSDKLVGSLDLLLNQIDRLSDWPLVDRLLSTISALFVCLPSHSDRIPMILKQISRILSITDCNVDSLKATKRHALSDLLRLVTDFTDVVLPLANSIFSMAQTVALSLSLMQQSQLLMSLAVLSNYFSDSNEQINFLACTLESTVQYLTNDTVITAVSSVDCFLKFLGLLDASPNEENMAVYPFISNRKELRGYCAIVEAVLGQVKPKETNIAQVFEVFKPILMPLFSLARCLNGLYTKAAMDKIHSSFGSAIQVLDVPEVEKLSISSTVDMQQRSADGCFELKTNSCHVRSFLNEITESIQITLGLIPVRFGYIFYGLPNASQFLLHGCLGYMDDCLDLRIRYMIRRTWKPITMELCKNDDKNNIRVALPAISALIIHMQTRLYSRWDMVIKQLDAVDDDPSKEQTNQEVFMEDVTRVLTRDYFSLLQKMLLIDSLSSLLQDKQSENGQSQSENVDKRAPRLSRICQLLLDDQTTLPALVLTIFGTLTWRDSVSVAKSLPLCELIIERLIDQNKLDGPTAQHLLFCALKSLQHFFDDECLFGLLITLNCHLYEKMRPTVPEIKTLIMQIPECTEQALDHFEEKVFSSTSSRKLPEKIKRDLFRKLVKSIIGKSVSQQFKRPAQIRNLPPLLKPQRQTMNKPLSEDLGICALFAG